MIDEETNLHGGNIYMASERYGKPREDFLDYSANINPLGIPEELKELIASNIDVLLNYPDPECNDLKEEISSYLNVDKDRIVIGNGAAEIIYLLFDELRPQKVLIPAPTFCEYERAAIKYNAEIVYFELREKESFKLDVDCLGKNMQQGIDCIILCNPNNPTSVLTPTVDLYRILRFALSRGIKVVIDETFIELTIGSNSNSMTQYLDEFENLFIIRAFTKLFAVPGLRLGYGLGNSGIIKRLWEKKVPWSVNSFAGISGVVLRNKTGYLERTALWLSQEAKRFYNELILFDQFRVFKPDTNFILLRILNENLNSGKLKELMAFNGVLIRDASNFKFLDDRFIRIAIKDRASNDKFLNILKEVVKE